MSLGARIRTMLAIDPAAVAIDFEDGALHWGALAAIVDAIDTRLADAGIGPGAPIGLLLRNRPPMIGAILAVLATERCIVCINPEQGGAKRLADLADLRVAAVVGCAEDFEEDAVRDVLRAAGSMGIALASDGAVSAVPGLERPGPGPHRAPAPGVAVEMLTSGTTGPPKRVQLRASALEKAILGASHYEKSGGDVPTLKTSHALLSAPLVHIGGMFFAVKSAADGRPVCLLDRFRVEAWRAAVVRHRPKVTGLVPSAMKMVLDANVPREDLESLRAVTSGTAPLAPEIQEIFEARYGIPVLITYGATEFAGAVAGWTIQDHRAYAKQKRGSVGRAHPGCELRVVDPETDAVLAADESGLLEVRTEQAPRDGWVRTADRARIDADGFLWIEGRADGAINRGGFKIDPAGVARVLEGHPAVREAAVVGLPDERLGEVPAAMVELKDGATPPSADELAAYAREHLTRYHVPARFLVVDEIPRTPSLKPSYPAMRARFTEEGAP